jgi:hypothetical protein
MIYPPVGEPNSYLPQHPREGPDPDERTFRAPGPAFQAAFDRCFGPVRPTTEVGSAASRDEVGRSISVAPLAQPAFRGTDAEEVRADFSRYSSIFLATGAPIGARRPVPETNGTMCLIPWPRASPLTSPDRPSVPEAH